MEGVARSFKVVHDGICQLDPGLAWRILASPPSFCHPSSHCQEDSTILNSINYNHISPTHSEPPRCQIMLSLCPGNGMGFGPRMECDLSLWMTRAPQPLRHGHCSSGPLGVQLQRWPPFSVLRAAEATASKSGEAWLLSSANRSLTNGGTFCEISKRGGTDLTWFGIIANPSGSVQVRP